MRIHLTEKQLERNFKIGVAIYSSMFGLGVYRGIQKYNYNMRKNKYLPPYLYTSAFTHGIGNGLVYMAFPLWVFILPKEIYRLEVSLRGLKEEKEKGEYYEII